MATRTLPALMSYAIDHWVWGWATLSRSRRAFLRSISPAAESSSALDGVVAVAMACRRLDT